MNDLAEFLLARIAQDAEAVNDRTRHLAPGGWSYLEQFGDFGDDERWMIEIPAARLLAECEAKRQVVDVYRVLAVGRHDVGSIRWHEVIAYETVLRQLALPYASHPDYRDEWRP